jgi:hypothetical protein
MTALIPGHVFLNPNSLFFFFLRETHNPQLSLFRNFGQGKSIYIMAKDKHKKNQPQRHDPLHVQLNEENDFTHAPIRKQPRQKFIDRSKRGDEEEVQHEG